MKTCSSCKWWGADVEEGEYVFGMSCDEYKPCAHPKISGSPYTEGHQPCGPDGAASLDVIGTGPDFGCIHWEAKS